MYEESQTSFTLHVLMVQTKLPYVRNNVKQHSEMFL